MLVVDDDEVIRQLIAVNLTLEGFEVFTAVDGQDCLDRVVDVQPDVITLDVMMPRLDGWVTATQLRRNPVTAGIKVVLITARAGGRPGPGPAGGRRRLPDQAVRPGRDDPRRARAGGSAELGVRLAGLLLFGKHRGVRIACQSRSGRALVEALGRASQCREQICWQHSCQKLPVHITSA